MRLLITSAANKLTQKGVDGEAAVAVKCSDEREIARHDPCSLENLPVIDEAEFIELVTCE